MNHCSLHLKDAYFLSFFVLCLSLYSLYFSFLQSTFKNYYLLIYPS
jgi:hypothetical protein